MVLNGVDPKIPIYYIQVGTFLLKAQNQPKVFNVRMSVVVVMVWQLDLQLPMQSVSITTKFVSINPSKNLSNMKSMFPLTLRYEKNLEYLNQVQFKFCSLLLPCFLPFLAVALVHLTTLLVFKIKRHNCRKNMSSLGKNLNMHCYFTIFTVSYHPSFLFDPFISTQIHTLHEKYFQPAQHTYGNLARIYTPLFRPFIKVLLPV